MEKNIREGESPVYCPMRIFHVRCTFEESRSLGFERKICGKFHTKLNIDARPIANKYHEGKMKRTLERELKVPEIAEREAFRTILHPEKGRVGGSGYFRHDTSENLMRDGGFFESACFLPFRIFSEWLASAIRGGKCREEGTALK